MTYDSLERERTRDPMSKKSDQFLCPSGFPMHHLLGRGQGQRKRQNPHSEAFLERPSFTVIIEVRELNGG